MLAKGQANSRIMQPAVQHTAHEQGVIGTHLLQSACGLGRRLQAHTKQDIGLQQVLVEGVRGSTDAAL